MDLEVIRASVGPRKYCSRFFGRALRKEPFIVSHCNACLSASGGLSFDNPSNLGNFRNFFFTPKISFALLPFFYISGCFMSF